MKKQPTEPYGPHAQYSVLVAYAHVKLQQRDWHGLADAANDIRVLVAAHPELEKDTRGTPA